MSRPLDSVRYKYRTTIEFDKQFRKLTKKDKVLKDRLLGKIDQIVSDPQIGDPKRHDMKHARGSHVDPFVIIYTFDDNIITFIYVDHHDKVYKKAPSIVAKYNK